MSLQSDFELCLDYAKALEGKREQQVRAQNNIIFMQNESDRLKNKLRICTTLSVLSIIGILIFVFSIIGAPAEDLPEVLPILVVPAAILITALFVRIKTKKEADEFEAQKPSLIQQYTADAEECEREIVRIVKEIYREELFDIVPSNYFSVAAIEFCLTQVRKKLANTAAEAFRQLDAEIKRLEQMAYLEQMYEAQTEQLNDIKRAIEINTLVTIAEKEKERERERERYNY